MSEVALTQADVLAKLVSHNAVIENKPLSVRAVSPKFRRKPNEFIERLAQLEVGTSTFYPVAEEDKKKFGEVIAVQLSRYTKSSSVKTGKAVLTAKNKTVPELQRTKRFAYGWETETDMSTGQVKTGYRIARIEL